MAERTGERLEVRAMNAWYGQAQVLRDINMVVRQREVVGLFGHNGAGKSTLLNCIARMHRQMTGYVVSGTTELQTLKPSAVARIGVRLLPEGSRVYDTMSVEEQIVLGARLSRRPTHEMLESVFELFPVLGQRRRVLGGYLSGGQRQMLALGVALAGDPSYLLLDEPSTGLAHVIVDQLYETLRRLAAAGVGMLIAEQTSQQLAQISKRGYLLETGVLRAEGPPSTFLSPAAQTGWRA